MELVTITELKKELGLTQKDLAKFFNMTYGAFANSSAKQRYEDALCNLYGFVKTKAGGQTLKTGKQNEPKLNELKQACFISHVSNLLNCPFCGHAAKLEKVNEGLTVAKCVNDYCHAQPFCEGDNETDAVEQWNTRAI